MTWADRYPATKLVPYDEGWPRRYADLAAGLRQTLGEGWQIEHVGATTLPRLAATPRNDHGAAKPVIDLALSPPPEVSQRAIDRALGRAGWTIPEPVGDHHAAFVLDGATRLAIAHIFTPEQWPTAHVRLFANWLRTRPTDRDAYAHLKTGLVADDVWGSEYTQAKRAFVLGVVNAARAEMGLAATTI